MKKSAAVKLAPERKGIADQLDRLVAERTAELAAINEQLRKELSERKQAEESRREELLNLIVESIPAPVAVTSQSGEVEALNKPTLEYFGKTFDELKGWKSSDVVHPDDLERTIAAQLAAHQTGRTYNVESRHRRADGVYRWFNVLGLPLRDAQGNILHWFHLLVDIDDRKRAEEALRSAERNLTLTINTIPTFIAVLAADGSVLSVNQAALDYHGITLQDVQREDFRSRWYHPDDEKRLREELNGKLTHPHQFEYEQRALSKEGEYRRFLVRFNPLLNEQEEIDRWYATAFDIEDRKRAEDALVRQAGVRADVSEAFSKPAHLGEILRGCMEAIVRHLDAAFARIWILNKDESMLELRASAGMYTRLDGSYSKITVGDLKVGWIAREKKAHLTNDVISDPRVRNKEWAKDNGIVAFAGYPLTVEDQVIGVVALFARHPVSESILDTLGSVADTIAQGIQRKRAEDALSTALAEIQKSESKLRQVIDAIPAMAWAARRDGTGEFFNQHYLDYVGLSAEQVANWGWTAVVHPDDLESLTQTWQHTRDSEQLGEGEVRLRRHDGEYRWFLFRASPVRDDSGRVVNWYGINIDITDRKLALERLQSNQDLLELAQKSAGAIAFDWYIQQEINYWSPEQEALFGLPPGTFDGTYRTWKKMMYAPDWPTVVDAIKHAHQTGKVSAEYRVIWPDGSLHWLSTNGRMFFDDAGEPLRMVGFTSDVTRRKLVEEDLRRSEAFLAQAQQLSRTGSFLWHVATDKIIWSEELYRVYEFDPDTTVTFGLIRTRVHPEDLTLYEKMVEQARNGAEDFEWQYRLLMPDQSIKYLQAVARATRNDDGQLEYLAAVQDITRRKLREEEIRRSEAFLAEGQHLARMGNFWWQVVTDQIVWSKPMYRIFDFEPGTTVTLELIASRVHPDDMSMLHDMIERAQQGEDFEYELRIIMRDASVKYLHLIAHHTRGDHRGPEYIGAVQDVTQRRLSEEALSKARSELAHVSRVMSLGTLTASIAHEVNQPLSGIITNASTCVRMLDADPPNVDGARETATRTIRDGRRAADVITRLRALFSKKEAAAELVDLNEATLEVIALSRGELERNRVITKTELAEQLPLVTGDRVQLQQVILNLLRNASDAMKEVDDRPRELLFKTEIEDRDQVRLSVQDSGIGFAGQSPEQLFHSFYTTKENGMGIGLSVSRSIIENHHGRLSATPNDGPGVTLSFSIPCAIDGAEGGSPSTWQVQNE